MGQIELDDGSIVVYAIWNMYMTREKMLQN